MFARNSIMSIVARTMHRTDQIKLRDSTVSVASAGRLSETPGDSYFDDFSRSVASQEDRRSMLRVTFFGVCSLLLGGIGMKEAKAAASCLCGRELYDSATQCCTPTGIKTKYPIADLAACPNRVEHKGPPCAGNGCGAEGDWYVPNSFGAAAFVGCCNGHDCCWGKCNSNRNGCDQAFVGCLLQSCDTAYPPSITNLPVVGPVDMNKIKRGACRAAANKYFSAVQSTRFGTPNYIAAQQEACDCCGTQPCVTCPGGTCGALPSCQDPGCVCFQTIEGKGFCHLPQSCAGLPTCSSSASCPAGWACVSVTCCGSTSICIRPCFVVGASVASPFAGVARLSGPMTDGS